MNLKIKNKNAILELLQAGNKFEKILMADNIFKDDKVKEILKIASQRKIPVSKLPKRVLQKRKGSAGYENITGILIAENIWNLDNLIDDIYQKKEDIFFLILNNIKYSQNIGAIMRTAFAVGVNGIITQTKRNSILNEEVLHISMGVAVRIPIVEMNIFEAMKKLKNLGIQIFSIDMKGKTYFKENMKGAVAFILGAEDRGVSSKVLEKTEKKISIPMKKGIDSLNVSVSAGVILYEKLRQDNLNNKKYEIE
jgi:23S rRNA (guanosine2251-2'-O)-methyltransferase